MILKDKINNYISRIANVCEPYIKTDLRYFLKGGGWILGTNIIGSVISFVLFIIIARYVPKEIYGIYKYILSVISILGALSLTGMNLAVARATAQGRVGVFRTALIEQIKWIWIQIIIAIGIAIYYFSKGNNLYSVSFLIAGLLSPISLIANTYRSTLSGEKKFKTLSFYNLISGIFYFIAMGLAFITASTSYLWLVIIYYIVSVISNSIWCIVIYIKNKRKEQLSLTPDEKDYAKHLSVINILSTITTYADNVILYYFLGPTSLALFNFAISVPERIRGLFGFISSLAFPKITEKMHENIQKSIGRKVLQLVFLGLILAGIYILIAPFIFKFIFPQYSEAIPYSQLFSLSLVSIALNISQTALTAQNKKRTLYITNTIVPLFQIGITIIGVFYLGIWGAVGARVIGQLVFLGTTSYQYLFSNQKK